MVWERKRPRCVLGVDSAIHGARSGYPPADLPTYFPGGDGGVPGLGRIRRSHPLSADRDRFQRQSRLERPHSRRAGDRRAVHLPAGYPAVPRNTLGQLVDRRGDRRSPAGPHIARANGGDAQCGRGRARLVDHHHPRDPGFDRHEARRGPRAQPLSGWAPGLPRTARHVLGSVGDRPLDRRRHRQHEDRGRHGEACSTTSSKACPRRSPA